MSVESLSGVGLISGGLDSTVVASIMVEQYEAAHFVFVDYGQTTGVRERESFDALVDRLQPASSQVLDLTWMRQVGRSALFEEETVLTHDNRFREYVAFRNANLLAAGVAVAETVGASAVLIGSTGTDRTCPDNSLEFIQAFQTVVDTGTMSKERISIIAPLIELDKKGVIELGRDHSAPFELSWSCHNNTDHVACGGCTNCIARVEGFAAAGLIDPLEYAN